jgi:hypothetical protein
MGKGGPAAVARLNINAFDGETTLTALKCFRGSLAEHSFHPGTYIESLQP